MPRWLDGARVRRARPVVRVDAGRAAVDDPAMSADAKEPTNSDLPPLKVAVAYRRSPAVLLKLLGLSVVCMASVPAILWIRPSLTTEFVRGGRRTPGLNLPSLTNLLIYGVFFLLGLIGVVGVVAVLVGIVRGVLVGACPACAAKVMPGGNREMSCPDCARKLEVVIGD